MHIIVFCDFFAETDRPLLIVLTFVNRVTNGLRKLVLYQYKTVIFILICFGVSIYNDGLQEFREDLFFGEGPSVHQRSILLVDIMNAI
jgi:hypothetical protein